MPNSSSTRCPQTFILREHLMEDQNDKTPPRSRVKKRSNISIYVAIAAGVTIGILFYLFMQNSPSTLHIAPPDNSTGVSVGSSKVIDPSTDTIDQEEEVLASPDVVITNDKRPNDINNSHSQERGLNADSLTSGTTENTSNLIQQNLFSESDPQNLIDEINSFYTHLDQQPYIHSFGLKETSKVHFSKLLQKLVDHPPVVTRETDDLYTLLKNTAHFFRIIGKENINIIKGILGNEQNSFEHILEIFYKLTYHPDYLKKEYSLSIPPDALTDYAAFFLNTMGGRLYLFRRDSTSRMVVNYYAIISIDRANIEGNGGHGIDLKPSILSLIEEIENGGGRLQLKEKYLDTLYDLQEKYS